MSHAEIFAVATKPKLAETGGAHNQKGINFQRVWAVARMVELDQGGQDFLMLFEAIQDVAEFDSEVTPSTVRVYQVKKKDKASWKWRELTGLYEVGSKSFKAQSLDDAQSSTLGKLYDTVRSFHQIASTGHFVSNMGCALSLAGGGSADGFATHDLAGLEAKYRDTLSSALATFHDPGQPAPDLARLHVLKVSIHPDAAEQGLKAIAYDYLKSKSPPHAAQAETLVQALLLAVGTRSAKTDGWHDFNELRQVHGFSRSQFQSVVSALETIPDVKNIVNGWLDSWPDQTIPWMARTRIKVQVSKIFQMRLGQLSGEDAKVVAAVETWLSDHSPDANVSQLLVPALDALAGSFPGFHRDRLIAHFLMRAAERCVDPTFDF